jgi:predicted AlkP superfamily pyrophosphatase or phosphodiesterase
VTKKVVLAVIDGLKPSMLERAVASGRAPALQRIMAEGVYVDDCVAAFPSVTPACAASIATGVGPAEHHIPSMNWWYRGEQRYVEYGSSFSASRQFGFVRSLTDTVYNMNLEHLAKETPTVFERLDDADIRTAGTTYLMYRGRHRHEVSKETALARLATSTVFRHAVYGPREFFYADIFASRKTGCRGQLGMPGVRDQHSGCVGAYLVENDLFDFLLLSLPDNDTWSHRNGPHAQPTSIAAADKQLERLMHAGGGPDAFLSEYAVIVMADHSHAAVEIGIPLDRAFSDFAVAPPLAARANAGDAEPEIALCPAQRSAMLYVLNPEDRDELLPKLIETAESLDGVDLVVHRSDSGEVVVRSPRGELRFQAGGALVDPRGESWSVDGDLEALEASIEDGVIQTPDYPDALSRLWSEAVCPTAGDVLLSAAPGYEFVDWGGQDHVGGGSHGSLHHSDSLGALLWCGIGPDDRDARPEWTIRDVVPMVLDHFGVELRAPTGS